MTRITVTGRSVQVLGPTNAIVLHYILDVVPAGEWVKLSSHDISGSTGLTRSTVQASTAALMGRGVLSGSLGDGMDRAYRYRVNMGWLHEHIGDIVPWRGDAALTPEDRRSILLGLGFGPGPESEWASVSKFRQKVVAFLVKRDGSDLCWYCQREPGEEIEHWVPRRRFRLAVEAWSADNLVLACPRCNTSKGSRTADEWLDSVAS